MEAILRQKKSLLETQSQFSVKKKSENCKWFFDVTK